MTSLPIVLALALAVLLAGSALVLALVQRRATKRAAAHAATVRARADELAARLRVADAALGRAEVERHALEDAHHNLLRRADRQGELIGIAAHDLRNPLSNITGFADLLLEGQDDLPPKARDFLSLIRDDAQRMLSIVKEVLEAEVVDEDNVPIVTKRQGLSGLAAEVVRWSEGAAQRKDITLRFGATDDVVAPVDGTQFQRVLDNLLSNAVKFSPKGSNVWVRVARNGHAARVSVRDEGPGLTKEDHQKLFGKLQRLSAKPTGDEVSTGLGLYIARTIARLHGGDIEVESVPGKGATFTIVLPLYHSEPPAEKATPAPTETAAA